MAIFFFLINIFLSNFTWYNLYQTLFFLFIRSWIIRHARTCFITLLTSLFVSLHRVCDYKNALKVQNIYLFPLLHYNICQHTGQGPYANPILFPQQLTQRQRRKRENCPTHEGHYSSSSSYIPSFSSETPSRTVSRRAAKSCCTNSQTSEKVLYIGVGATLMTSGLR